MKTPQKKINELISTVIIISSLALAGCSKEAETISESEQQTTQTVVTTTESTTEATTTTTTEATTTTTTEATTETTTESTYEENEYYSLVEKGNYSSSSTYQYVIHKITAKKDCKISATAVVYDKNGSVIGKDEDEIVLVKGKNNYFKFLFSDISAKELSNATIEYSSVLKKDLSDSNRAEDREIFKSLHSEDDDIDVDIIQMTDESHKKNKLFITLSFVWGEMSYFDKYKILFYKKDKIVGCQDGYINVHAENIKAIGDKEVVEIWVPSSAKGFDRIEYIFEPYDYVL